MHNAKATILTNYHLCRRRPIPNLTVALYRMGENLKAKCFIGLISDDGPLGCNAKIRSSRFSSPYHVPDEGVASTEPLVVGDCLVTSL